jgi:hypothetical protein
VPAAEDPDVPDIPGYRFERRLGRGGMGDVFLVEDLHLAQPRALKVARFGGRDRASVRARFEREVKTLAAVRHPNVVPVYTAGEANGHLYFVMEYVPGGAVVDHLARFTGDPRACAALIAKAARGVQALHDRGFLHRDLKPHNLLLGDGDAPLVADTGLTALLAELAAVAPEPPPAPGAHPAHRTVSGAVVGTLAYMPPEQVLGLREEYGPGCDVWALGVTLYELLAGRRPFTGDDTAHQILHDDPPPLPAGVPPDLAQAVRRCLGKCPADRYGSARELAADLERWLAGPWYTRRGVLVAGGLAALAAAGVGAWFGLRPRPSPWPLTLIGPTGPPSRVDLVAGSKADAVRLAPDGFCEVAADEHALAELYAGPFPTRWVFEAEVRAVRAGKTGQFGIYVARRDWLYEPREVHTFVALTVNDPWVSRPPPRPKGLMTRHALVVAAWAAGEPGLGRNDVATGNTESARPVEWYRVGLEVSPDGVRPADDYPPARVTEVTAARDLRSVINLWKPRPAFTTPVLGPGLGLGILAIDATVWVRNATVRAVPAGTA